MRFIICLFLIILALGQFVYFGMNIFSFMVLLLISFVIGVISALGEYGAKSNQYRDNSSARDLAMLAQIERNRYFRKHEQ